MSARPQILVLGGVFAAGDPFHAGRVWNVMDVGLKAMSGVLAD
jgi:hypothetical protein